MRVRLSGGCFFFFFFSSFWKRLFFFSSTFLYFCFRHVCVCVCAYVFLISLHNFPIYVLEKHVKRAKDEGPRFRRIRFFLCFPSQNVHYLFISFAVRFFVSSYLCNYYLIHVHGKREGVSSKNVDFDESRRHVGVLIQSTIPKCKASLEGRMGWSLSGSRARPEKEERG